MPALAPAAAPFCGCPPLPLPLPLPLSLPLVGAPALLGFCQQSRFQWPDLPQMGQGDVGFCSEPLPFPLPPHLVWMKALTSMGLGPAMAEL